ncbi:E3 ubiquitin-protein ligase RMA3-like isoform X2 [Amaranthus tricolor]|nr:E3 ubiquitin-protein ligase RMA3-like isoform X2 [Amaranthus tricolor]
MSQNFQDYTAECRTNEDATTKQKFNSGLAPTIESESKEGSFDCNICFDLAHDPVVTLCGHLYCWACIYKWLHVKSSYFQPEAPEKSCPVCKANISQTSLIPLYCHSPSHSSDELRTSNCEVIPPRPTAAPNPLSNQQHTSNLFESHYPEFRYGTLITSNLVSPTMAGIINPTIELLGELVYTRMFGNTGSSSLSFPLWNSYTSVRFNDPRMRRQELQSEKSLSRVSMFLFVCVLLCLLFF